MRIQRALARAGVASRRAAEEIVAAGRVRVNGVPAQIGQSGKREKDVTLAIGRELARQVNATPGLKAYMTRDTDVFIPLPRRAQLARHPALGTENAVQQIYPCATAQRIGGGCKLTPAPAAAAPEPEALT